MADIPRIEKPKTRRGKKALEQKAPKLIENDKHCLFINGKKTSDVGRQFLKCLYQFKKNDSTYLTKKNDIMPFETFQKLECLSKKHDASLFAVATHSKKRPDNIVIGRTYNHQILDMMELQISNFKSITEFANGKVSLGTKPCILFHGVGFTQSPVYVRLMSVLLDFFRGPDVKNVSLTGFELAIQFTMFENKIFMRCYRIHLKKTGTELPRAELEEIGPSATLTLRRTKLASEDLLKSACKKPKELKVKKVKNLNQNSLGTKLGRVHMQKQDLRQLQIRKTPAIKKAKQAQLQKKKTEKALSNAANAFRVGRN